MDKNQHQLTTVNDSSRVCSFDLLISLVTDDRRECGAASPSAAKRRKGPSRLKAEVFIVDNSSCRLLEKTKIMSALPSQGGAVAFLLLWVRLGKPPLRCSKVAFLVMGSAILANPTQELLCFFRGCARRCLRGAAVVPHNRQQPQKWRAQCVYVVRYWTTALDCTKKAGVDKYDVTKSSQYDLFFNLIVHILTMLAYITMLELVHISIPSQSNSVISTRPPNKLLILGCVLPQSPWQNSFTYVPALVAILRRIQ